MLPVSPTAAQIKGHAPYRTRTRLRQPQNCGPDVRAVAILRFAKRHHWSRPNQQPHGVSAEPAVAVTASDQPCAERGNRDEAKAVRNLHELARKLPSERSSKLIA